MPLDRLADRLNLLGRPAFGLWAIAGALVPIVGMFAIPLGMWAAIVHKDRAASLAYGAAAAVLIAWIVLVLSPVYFSSSG